jgi:hypothetical protein
MGNPLADRLGCLSKRASRLHPNGPNSGTVANPNLVYEEYSGMAVQMERAVGIMYNNVDTVYDAPQLYDCSAS